MFRTPRNLNEESGFKIGRWLKQTGRFLVSVADALCHSSACVLAPVLVTRVEKSHNLSRVRRVAALMAECEDTTALPRTVVENSWRNWRMTQQLPSKRCHEPTQTPNLTGRWEDSVHDDRGRKARWTKCGYEKTLNGNEDFFSATPAWMHLEIMLVDAALKGARDGNSRLQRGFPPGALFPRHNRTHSVNRVASTSKAWDLTSNEKLSQHSLG